MRNRVLTRSLAVFAALTANISAAHHAISSHFDPGRSIEIRGVVVDFKLRSPHSLMVIEGQAYVDGVEQTSADSRWEIESGSVPAPRRIAIGQDTFQPGEQIRVIALPNRKPDYQFVFSDTFIKEDGTEFSSEFADTPDAGEIELGEAVPADLNVPLAPLRRIAGRWLAPLVLPEGNETPSRFVRSRIRCVC